MAALTHVATWSKETWPRWAMEAKAFAQAWRRAYETSTVVGRSLTAKDGREAGVPMRHKDKASSRAIARVEGMRSRGRALIVEFHNKFGSLPPGLKLDFASPVTTPSESKT